MEKYYKAVRPDGTSFYDQRTRWAVGKITRHADADLVNPNRASRYLSVSVSPADCTGFRWPARLFEVAPVRGHKVIAPNGALPNKRASDAWKPVAELPAHELFGPQGEHVVALIDGARTLTGEDCGRLYAARNAAGDAAWYAARNAAWGAAWGAAWDAAWDAARDAAWYAAWDAARDAAWYAARNAAWYAAWGAAWDAAWDAARDAARALVVRDKISTDHYDTLTKPWRQTIGTIHPDDPAVA